MPTKRGIVHFLPLILVAGLIVLAGVGMFYFSQDSDQPLITKTSEPSSGVDMADWETYVNEEYGFMFRHPPATKEFVPTVSVIEVDSLDQSIIEYKDFALKNEWIFSNKKFVDFTPEEYQFELLTDSATFATIFFEVDGQAFKLESQEFTYLPNILSTFEFLPDKNWQEIVEAFENCEVIEAFQYHNLDVRVNTKNRGTISGVEPRIDDIAILIDDANEKCGTQILFATE